MKKILLSAFVGAMSLGFMACSQETDPAQPVNVPDFMQQTATVTGYVVMNEDLVASKQTWSSPKSSDFKMIVSVPYSDLISGDVSGRMWSTTNVTYTPGSGKFSAVVPVGFAGSDVTITLNDFTGTQRQYDPVNDKNVDVNVIWKWGADRHVDVKANGQVVYLDEEPVILTALPIKTGGDII